MCDSKRVINKNEETSGTVLRIERSSVFDGDGFRTVIFLKGCPLRCQWCSTPESWDHRIEQAEDVTYGKIMTVNDILKEVRKDSCCYFHSNGGMTLSGGEILAQPKFTLEILKAVKDECINTAIETSFYGAWKLIEPILSYVDTAFVDMKFFSKEKHKQYVGVDNQRILDNLLKTNDVEKPFKLVIRTPIIPGITDDEKELEQIGRFCAELKHLKHVQLLPYHRLGTDTYRKMGIKYPITEVLPPTAERMSQCREIINKFVNKVI